MGRGTSMSWAQEYRYTVMNIVILMNIGKPMNIVIQLIIWL